MRDALGMAAQVHVLRLERVDQCFDDVDAERAERELLALELRGSKRDFLANEALDVSLLDRESAPVQHALDGLLQVGELDGLHQVVHRTGRQHFGRRRRVVDGGEHDDGELRIDRERARDKLARRSGPGMRTSQSMSTYLPRCSRSSAAGPDSAVCTL